MKKIRCFSALLLVIFLSGCAQLEEMGAKFDQMAAESRLKEYDSVLDKALVDNFYIISEDGLEYGLSDLAKEDGFSFDSLAQSKIVFEKRMYQSPNMGDMYSTMRGYGYDSESDSLSKAYISMAKKTR